MSRKIVIASLGLLALYLLTPSIAYASVESTLSNIQGRLTGSILPLVAILGFIFAGISLVGGSPNGRQYLYLAIMGTVIGFAAESIVTFLRGLVQ